jgi:hypothetical protein
MKTQLIEKLFVYGTLADIDVLRLVLGFEPKKILGREGTLYDHGLFYVKDEEFPLLQHLKAEVVKGRILKGLEGVALERVLYFEDDDFTLMGNDIVAEDGEKLEVQLFQPSEKTKSTDIPWIRHDWERREKYLLLERIERFMAGFGAPEKPKW